MENPDKRSEVQTQEEAVDLANEINRLDSALKTMKSELKKFVEEQGSIDTGEEIWDFYESVSWKFDEEGLKELARIIAFEGYNPWSLMNLPKSNLNKLGWDESYLETMGEKKVTHRFMSRKKK